MEYGLSGKNLPDKLWMGHVVTLAELQFQMAAPSKRYETLLFFEVAQTAIVV
jgi:hypothetical protein